jgi:hypothetical protein
MKIIFLLLNFDIFINKNKIKYIISQFYNKYNLILGYINKYFIYYLYMLLKIIK